MNKKVIVCFFVVHCFFISYSMRKQDQLKSQLRDLSGSKEKDQLVAQIFLQLHGINFPIDNCPYPSQEQLVTNQTVKKQNDLEQKLVDTF